MRDNPRTQYVAALAGVVLLGGIVAFTVVVPELGDDPATEPAGSSQESSAPGSSNSPITLPDQLPTGQVALDTGTLPATLTGPEFDVEQVRTQQDGIEAGLQKTFGVPGAFRAYANPDGKSAVTVLAVDKAPGPFVPDTLPIDPALNGLARDAQELVKVDDAVCSINWGENGQVPEGQPVPTDQVPASVRCEIGDGDRTYDASAQNLTVDQTLEILRSLTRT